MLTWRRMSGLFLLPLMLGLGVGVASAQQTPPDRSQTVDIVKLHGTIDSAYAGYLRDEIRRAEREGHLAVLLWLHSGGTLGVDDEALYRLVRDAAVPVATWVGYGDDRVAGGATLLWLAGDARFVATDAELRSAQPLEPGGKVNAAATAFAATSSRSDGRLLEPGTRLSAADAVAQGVADRTDHPVPVGGEGKIVAGSVNSLSDVITNLDGREINGRTLDVDSTKVTVRFTNPGLLRRVQHPLNTRPTMVYLLLVVGAGSLVFELFQRGFGPAGYAGVLLLGLAAVGLVGLPVSPVGLALVLVGLVALTLDVARGGLGVPTWGGTAALAAGSVLLVQTEDRGALGVTWWGIALGVVGSWVFYVVVMTVVLRALRGQQAATGTAMLGRVGEVRSTLNPQGHVLVEGALWRARALEWDGAVPTGTQVTVTGVDEQALILDVEPLPEKG